MVSILIKLFDILKQFNFKLKYLSQEMFSFHMQGTLDKGSIGTCCYLSISSFSECEAKGEIRSVKKHIVSL